MKLESPSSAEEEGQEAPEDQQAACCGLPAEGLRAT